MRMVPAVQAVNVVVTCTQAKRVAPAVHAGTGAIDLALPASERVEAWAAALEQGGQAVEARNLYSGDHWSVSCGMHRPPEVSVWVASAGYGLVGVDAPLCPYAATFRLGEEDSVCETHNTTAYTKYAYHPRYPNATAWKLPTVKFESDDDLDVKLSTAVPNCSPARTRSVNKVQ